jgi:3-hydroxyisobutyrate dehydrogenase-like beta-hydroxyacid dehydrogenase
MMQQPRVGFVGLGDIGEPMARRIIDANFPVTLWARRAASLEPFRGANFTQAPSLAELGRGSDVVGVCVFSEDDVREVILGDTGILEGMRRGGIILVHSTVSVEFVLDLERQCADHGVIVMDVPVSGFRGRAVSGQLTVMAGGPRTSFEAVLPILNAFGSDVEYLGPVGSGLKMKALNQALLLANFTSASLALSIGRELGLDRVLTEKVLRSASGSSAGLDLIASRILTDPPFAKLAEEMMAKDLLAFDSLCRSSGVDADEFRAISGRAISAIEQLRAKS